MQSVIPRPDVAPLLQEHFVALAADADDPEPEVTGLAQQVEDAMMLPFVIFASAEGQFLEGSSGLIDPARFVARLEALAR